MTALQPTWLVAGALVQVLAGSSRSEPRRELVRSVDWPWLVHLDGWPGGVHPARCAPIAES